MAVSVPLWRVFCRSAVKRLTAILTKPLKNYTVRFQNDVTALQRHMQKGDVLLVEGAQRVSEAIKYLTQSSWSHAALYIGDELLRRQHPLAERARTQYGDDANYLLVEALVEKGVVFSPITKYVDSNIRVCRPFNLRKDHRQTVLDEIIRHIGYTYDLQNVFDLARYFLPISLVPRRFRRMALSFGSGQPTRVICSSMLAAAFGNVGFPIVPRITGPDSGGPRAQSLLQRLSGLFDNAHHPLIFHRAHPTLITPRDFDLSPYFEVVKFNVIEPSRFDYRKIVWASESDAMREEEKTRRSTHFNG